MVKERDRMSDALWLAWNGENWGVYYGCRMPDQGAFPEYWYHKYEIPSGNFQQAFDGLSERKSNLEKDKVIPTGENQEKIFPKLEELLI